MAKGIRKTGEFCWFNMLTSQPKEACAFFGKLLGWTYNEVPGLGYFPEVTGRSIGGIFDLDGPNTPPGTPPHIGVMVKVDNADATGEKVKSLGGDARPAFDVMDAGRMTVCNDPNGARFDVWEPKKQQGIDIDSSLPGAPSWFETLTTNDDLAARFYADLFGWTAEAMHMPEWKYTTFKLGSEYVAGMMKITPEMEAAKLTPHWGTYFTVKNADDTAREAVNLGGKLCVPVKDIPYVGRFCGIISPQGVMFYAIEYTR